MNHAPNLLVASDHRIQFAAPGQLRQIAAVALERLVLGLGILIRHALSAAHLRERLEDAIFGDGVLLQQPRRDALAALANDAEEEVLGADKLILEARGLGLRVVGDLAEPLRHRWLRTAVRLRKAGQLLAQRGGERLRVDIHLPEDFRNDAFRLFDQRQQQMLRLDLRVAHLLGELLSRQNGFLGFLGEFVEIHFLVLS